MIEILKQKYNYYWVKSKPWLRQEYADVNVGDTFVDDSGNVYVKIPWAVYVENKTIGNKEFSIEEKDCNCVSLKDGSLQKFSDNSKVYLIDCQMKWDYRKIESVSKRG